MILWSSMTRSGCQPKSRAENHQNGWFISWKTLLELMIWGYPYFWKHPSFRYPRIWSIHWQMRHYLYTLRKKHESRDGMSNWLWLDLPRASPIWRSPILCLANHSAWSELSILSSKPTQNWKIFWISNTKKMQKVHLHGRKNPCLSYQGGHRLGFRQWHGHGHCRWSPWHVELCN